MQEHKYPIKKWAKDDQPREKLLLRGAGQLSNSELLAILINQGNSRRSAVDLAKDLLRIGKDDLHELGKLSVKEIMKINGLGQAKACVISAALELGRRRQFSIPIEKLVINSSKDIAAHLQSLLRDHRHEVFGVIFLNQGNRVKHYEIISQGGMTATVADPRIILKKALEEDAVSLILFHNHPSGNLKPSRADQELTLKVRDAARLLDIRLIDHIIVSERGYYSFADEGEL